MPITIGAAPLRPFTRQALRDRQDKYRAGAKQPHSPPFYLVHLISGDSYKKRLRAATISIRPPPSPAALTRPPAAPLSPIRTPNHPPSRCCLETFVAPGRLHRSPPSADYD